MVGMKERKEKNKMSDSKPRIKMKHAPHRSQAICHSFIQDRTDNNSKNNMFLLAL